MAMLTGQELAQYQSRYSQDPGFFKNQAQQWLSRAFMPREQYLASRPDASTNEPWNHTYVNWVLRAGGSPDELAQLINQQSNGSINVTGAQLNQLWEARQSGYSGDLPDNIAGLEGFYDRNAIEQYRAQEQAREAEKRRVREGFLAREAANNPVSPAATTQVPPPSPGALTPPAPATAAPMAQPTGMMRYPTVQDSSAWRAQYNAPTQQQQQGGMLPQFSPMQQQPSRGLLTI